MNRLWRSMLLTLVAALGAQFGTALSQSYPSRPIRIVVPFPAGGNLDTTARLLSPKMADALHQPVLVENRAGAGGNIGADLVAKSAPDGYTILIDTGLAIRAALYGKLPFDPVRDLVPVTQLIAATMILATGPKLPVASTRELIALAKSKPGTLTYGHSGVNGPLFLIMELLKLSAAIDILGVPYKGDAPINTALMAGEVDVAFVPASALQFIKDGRLRALGVSSSRRLTVLPNVSTVAEGGVSGFEYVGWQGLFLPGKTPRDIVERIHREAVKAIRMPDVEDRIVALGQEVVGSTPAEFDAKYKSDLAKFTAVVMQAHIPLQD